MGVRGKRITRRSIFDSFKAKDGYFVVQAVRPPALQQSRARSVQDTPERPDDRPSVPARAGASRWTRWFVRASRRGPRTLTKLEATTTLAERHRGRTVLHHRGPGGPIRHVASYDMLLRSSRGRIPTSRCWSSATRSRCRAPERRRTAGDARRAASKVLRTELGPTTTMRALREEVWFSGQRCGCGVRDARRTDRISRRRRRQDKFERAHATPSPRRRCAARSITASSPSPVPRAPSSRAAVTQTRSR